MQPPDPTTPSGSPAGTVGGRYALASVLGRGGAGTVWGAWDTVLERDVAVKEVVVPSGAGDPTARRERVLREARAAARLSHPNVVKVYDVVDDGERVHIVMELVAAPALDALVRRDGPLPPARAAAVGLDVLDALAAAEAEGIVHRDVKPGNVMVAGDGAKLADFGIASLHDDPSLTASGTVLGSPSYMAPEQARGERSTAASDRWALGATLHFAVEAVGPFDREGGALPTLNAVVHDAPRPTERAGPLAPIIAALLEKDPADRPSAAWLRHALGEVAAGHGAPDRAPTATEAAATAPGRPARPRRAATIAVAAVLVLVAGLAVAAALRGEPPTQVATEASGAPTPAPHDEVTTAAGGSDVAPQADVGGTPTARSGEPGPAPAAPDDASAGAQGGDAAPDSDDSDDSDYSKDSDDSGDDEGGETQQGAVPADWERYRDPATGYEIAHPPGWQVVPVEGSDTLTDFRDPDSARYLRVDWAEEPVNPPTAAWETMSASFASRYEDYEEIRLEPTTYQGHDAAVWEYRYTAGGTRLHGLDLGIAAEERGYALNYVTTEEDWQTAQPQFEVFKDAFVLPD